MLSRTNYCSSGTARAAGSTWKTLVSGLLAAMVVILVGLLLGMQPAHSAGPFVVNSTGDGNDSDYPSGTFDGSSDGVCDADSGTTGDQCTLRAAIQEANAFAGVDTINFQIPANTDPNCDATSGVCTIRPASALPGITEQAILDGYTQSGAQENDTPVARDGTNAELHIELSGALVGSGNGLAINAPDVVVRGLVINRFSTGIFISGDGSGAAIEGNFIGPDPSGTQLVSSTSTGVTIFGGGANTIGGISPAARNLISGNFRGLVIASNEGNTVQGNLIGTKANGTEGLGNTLEGVQIASSDNTVGANAVDTNVGANLIAFNGGDGVNISAPTASGNRVLSNFIHTNGELGIDLAGGTESASGVTKNDLKDPDTGANRLQNFPRLTSATTASGIATIKGALNSRPRKTFTIQFFSRPKEDSSGNREGKTFLGRKQITTKRDGTRSFAFLTTLPSGEEALTATATNDATGDTSEFSNTVIVK
jgi:trimeric autotransporter adhesin